MAWEKINDFTDYIYQEWKRVSDLHDKYYQELLNTKDAEARIETQNTVRYYRHRKEDYTEAMRIYLTTTLAIGKFKSQRAYGASKLFEMDPTYKEGFDIMGNRKRIKKTKDAKSKSPELPEQEETPNTERSETGSGESLQS
jgi:hypothetical protein